MKEFFNTNIEYKKNSDNGTNITIVQPLEGFYTVKDVVALTHRSKSTVLKMFQMDEFPSCDFGKEQIISKQAFYEFFSKKQSKADYACWRKK